VYKTLATPFVIVNNKLKMMSKTKSRILKHFSVVVYSNAFGNWSPEKEG